MVKLEKTVSIKHGLCEVQSSSKAVGIFDSSLVADVDTGVTLPGFRGTLGHKDIPIIKDDCKAIRDLVAPHIDSFNEMLRNGLRKAVKRIPPVEFEYQENKRIRFEITDAEIFRPCSTADPSSHHSERKLFPSECRVGKGTYKAPLTVKVKVFLNDSNLLTFKKRLAEVPVMVMSEACNLANLTESQLVEKQEESNEGGGYFIVNGAEKLIRLVFAQRRNYPAAVKRTSWKRRAAGFSDLGLVIRSVRDDGYSVNTMLHYLNNGSYVLCVVMNGQLFYVPFIVVIKALTSKDDFAIYGDVMQYSRASGDKLGRSVKSMLRQLLAVGVTSQLKALQYIGIRFRDKLEVPSWRTDEEVGKRVIEEAVFIHLDDFSQKYDFSMFCIRKLFSLVENRCKPDPIDTTMMHELVLPGQVYLSVLLEKLTAWLKFQRQNFLKTLKAKNAKLNSLPSLLQSLFAQPAHMITRGMDHFLSTGNVPQKCSVASMQQSGWVIMAERINILRYLAHFRSVHRGAGLLSMQSSSVRRLCPESFGFICPVNTPDGSLCGILTHLSAHCYITYNDSNTDDLVDMLIGHGMTPEQDLHLQCQVEGYPVMLDGCLIGKVHRSDAHNLFQFLREQKALGNPNVPKFLEICLIDSCPEGESNLYPGVYMFSTGGRMMRPVFNIATRTIEYIGSMEQVFMGVATEERSFVTGHTTHYELIPYAFMSFVASLTPFSEFNQSPRNMYQCQMGKQTVGTPCHNINGRSDYKMHKLVYGQCPLVKTRTYEFYDMDQYPSGVNAVVAVLSYTGYDMEDAMIINKAASDRGFGKTLVFSTEAIDLSDGKKLKCPYRFYRDPTNIAISEFIDSDGLPKVGVVLNEGDPFYSYVCDETGQIVVVKFKKAEPTTVMQVSTVANDSINNAPSTKACVLMQTVRNPIVGDKFSSRHGQKGVCSKLYPVTDLPFNEMGITPDIIFNPHGFPSRMTIGMMLEFLTGKAGATIGKCIDGSPFQFDNDRDGITAFECYGELLKKCGFSHHGTEVMYSGVTGEQLEVSVFMGTIFYQRLRHMVSDKFQVRRTGTYDAITRQPLKGRKRGGGIRVGEMERDAILAHGCAFTLVDRLLNCSDRTVVQICRDCGVLGSIAMCNGKLKCKICLKSNRLCKIVVPYVLTYLIAELSALNICTVLKMQKAH